MSLADIFSPVTALTGILGAFQSSSNAEAANKQAAQNAANGLQTQQNNDQYTKALNALALSRSTAGSVDSRGSTASYDPSTNTWRTQLSPAAAAIQHQGDQFTQQNLKDVTQGNAQTLSNNATTAAQAGEANNSALAEAAKARGDAGTARMKLANFRPMTAGDLEGDLQQVSTTANRQAQQPIIADTLRSMARTGTAAGPVLTSMMRDNATSLRQSMLQDHISALKNVGDVNNAQRSGLESTYAALNGAATPKLQFAGQGQLGSAPINDPSAALQNEIASRANNAGTTGIQAGSVNNQGAAAGVAARTLSVNNTPYNNSGDVLQSLAKQMAQYTTPDKLAGYKSAYNSIFGSGAGNAGDAAPWTEKQFGDVLQGNN